MLDDTSVKPPIQLADNLSLQPSDGGGYRLVTHPAVAIPLRVITIIDQDVIGVGRDDTAFPVLSGSPPLIFMASAFAGLTGPISAPDGPKLSPFVLLLPCNKYVALADLFPWSSSTPSGVTLWTFDPGSTDWSKVSSVELAWKLNATDKTVSDVPLYMSQNSKFLKWLAATPFAPQIAIVLSAVVGRGVPFQRTLAYGPSPSTRQGLPDVVMDPSRSQRWFRFAMANAATAVTCTPAGLTPATHCALTLVKYLVDGQTIFAVQDPAASRSFISVYPESPDTPRPRS